MLAYNAGQRGRRLVLTGGRMAKYALNYNLLLSLHLLMLAEVDGGGANANTICREVANSRVLTAGHKAGKPSH
jgi:hypothetical protein